MKRNRIVIASYLPKNQKWLDDPKSYESNFSSLCTSVRYGFRSSNGIPEIRSYVIIRKKICKVTELVTIDGTQRLGHSSFHSSFGKFEYNQEAYGVIVETYSREQFPDDILAVRIRSIIANILLRNVPHNLELKVGAFTGFDEKPINQQPPLIRSESLDELFYYTVNDEDLPIKKDNSEDPKVTFYKRIKSFVGKKIELNNSSSGELPRIR